MNTRAPLWIALILVIGVVFEKTPLLTIVFSFLVLGIIPGTDVIVPAWAILTIYPFLFILAMIWLSVQPLFIGELVDTTSKKSLHRVKTKSAAQGDKKQTTPSKKRARAAV